MMMMTCWQYMSYARILLRTTPLLPLQHESYTSYSNNIFTHGLQASIGKVYIWQVLNVHSVNAIMHMWVRKELLIWRWNAALISAANVSVNYLTWTGLMYSYYIYSNYKLCIYSNHRIMYRHNSSSCCRCSLGYLSVLDYSQYPSVERFFILLFILSFFDRHEHEPSRAKQAKNKNSSTKFFFITHSFLLLSRVAIAKHRQSSLMYACFVVFTVKRI